MLRDIVQIGDKIEVKQLNQKGEPIKSSKTYVSQIVDYIDEETISIASPITNGLLVILDRWINYRLYFYTSKGLYQCNCTVHKIYRENNMVIVLVKLTSELKKIQRRQYYRLECIHEIEYRLLTEEEFKLEERLHNKNDINDEERAEIRKKLAELNNSWVHACIIDISGGGCRFNSEEELKPGDKIRIKLDFILKNMVRKLEITADIIASQKMYNRIGFYEYRAEFTDINQKDREDLIKYIFEQERKRRKNEKTR